MSRNDIQPAGATPIWPLAPQTGGDLALSQDWGQRSYGASSQIDLNLATIWRIIAEWRWLIVGAVAVAVAGAIVITFLTTPLYRATAVLEINPPQVEVLENAKAKTQVNSAREYLSTQYGLMASRTLAERVAQEMNLASNAELVGTAGDRATREKAASSILAGNLKVEPVPNSML